MGMVASALQRAARACVVIAAAVALLLVTDRAVGATQLGYDNWQARHAGHVTLAEQLRTFVAARIPEGSRVYVTGTLENDERWRQRMAEALVLAGMLPVGSAAEAQYQITADDQGITVEKLP